MGNTGVCQACVDGEGNAGESVEKVGPQTTKADDVDPSKAAEEKAAADKAAADTAAAEKKEADEKKAKEEQAAKDQEAAAQAESDKAAAATAAQAPAASGDLVLTFTQDGQPVEIKVTTGPLRMRFDEVTPIFIKMVDAGSPAEAAGVKTGMTLIKVGDTDISGMLYSQAFGVLKEAVMKLSQASRGTVANHA